MYVFFLSQNLNMRFTKICHHHRVAIKNTIKRCKVRLKSDSNLFFLSTTTFCVFSQLFSYTLLITFLSHFLTLGIVYTDTASPGFRLKQYVAIVFSVIALQIWLANILVVTKSNLLWVVDNNKKRKKQHEKR